MNEQGQMQMDDLPRARKPKPRSGGGRRKQRETSEQIKVVHWARTHAMEYPFLTYLHHIPNGGARSPRQAAVLKKAGLVRGIPDLFLPYPAGPFHGLYVELKTGRNKPTPEQLAFIEYANRAGYRAVVCYGAEAAINAIQDYIEGV